MFNRYWRAYPWGLQIFLLLMMLMTLASFTTYIVLAIAPKLSGLSFAQLTQLNAASPLRTIRLSILIQAIAHAGTFTIPGLLFALVAHPRIREYLGLRAPGKRIHWLLVTGVMLGIIPVFLGGEAWMMQHLHFGQWADDLQASSDNMFAAFLRLNAPADLFLLLLVLSVLPAFGEEIVFRGVLLRLIHRRASTPLFQLPGAVLPAPDAQRTMVVPVIATALLFSAVHLNPYGFAFVFIAGMLLSLIYFLTGSLLCSMWAHLVYNGSQVALAFASHTNPALRKASESNEVPPLLILAGALLFAVSFYFLVKNQTPLAADWSDDFKGEAPDPQAFKP